nr:hypothetical protein [Quadrisphaera sp. INWT6]
MATKLPWPIPVRTGAPVEDVDDARLRVTPPHHAAAGATAVAVALRHGVEQMGPLRTAQTLLKLNQVDGFDCQGCACRTPTPSTATPRSSARTAPRPWPRRPPAAASPASSGPATP